MSVSAIWHMFLDHKIFNIQIMRKNCPIRHGFILKFQKMYLSNEEKLVYQAARKIDHLSEVTLKSTSGNFINDARRIFSLISKNSSKRLK